MKKIVSFLLVLTMLVPLVIGCKKESVEEPVGPVFDLTDEEIEVFSNHIEFSDSIGDPFVMRYEGKYYMYPSTSNDTPYYVYVSEDLVNWSDKIVCVSPDEIPSGINEHGKECSVALPAYAPEVTYFNGKFIMVTSLGGTGHQFFVADSPVGPFKKVGDKCGWKIDGHVFIDNNGKWYFYSANSQGIKVCNMVSPTVIGTEINTLSQINGKWTEGPMVVYHDGIYYMTYTGNHVQNRAYRIPYSVSTKTPYKFYTPDDNILLVSTAGEITSTGHSSTVKSPDLDSYYIVYHSHKGSGIGRRMNIDRIVFDGETMDVMGPTTEYQQVAAMPDIYSYFDSEDDLDIFQTNGKISSSGRLRLKNGMTAISKKELSGNKYTIEITTANIDENAKAGVIFGYSDDNNYGSAVFDTASEKLIVKFVVDGKETMYEKSLVRSFDMPYDFSAVQAIQVEKSGSSFTFYVNDRELCKYESTLSGTKVGLVAIDGEAQFGYLGASDEVGGSSNCDFYKPVGAKSGTVSAHLCLEDDTITTGRDEDQSKYVVASEDDSFNYRIYAASDGKYTFGLKYRSESDAVAEVYINGALAKTLSLPATDGEYSTVGASGLACKEGKNVVTIYMRSGNADLKSFTMLLTSEENMSLDFSESAYKGLIHTDGVSWKLDDGALLCRSIGKRTYGNSTWSDYIYECDMKVRGNTVDCGILVRTTNAAEVNLFSGTGSLMECEHSVESSTVGADWMQGYFVHFTKNEIFLKKCNFSSKVLVSEACKLKVGKTYHLKVECVGASIKIYINDTLVIDYTDPNPYLTGAVGLRLVSGSAVYDNLTVKIKEN